MPTSYIPTNDPKAVKLYSVMLFKENMRDSSKFLKLFSDAGSTSSQMAISETESVQTTPHMPVVAVSDLTKQAGDRVTVDLLNKISGKPIMGSKMAEGRGEHLVWDTDEFRINQTRKPVQSGDRMSQKRTVHNLRLAAKATLTNWFGRFNDQRIQVHLAGARGTNDANDWIVPLESDEDFAEIMVNPVTPPTTDRYFVAGGGDTVGQIGNTDALRLEDFDVISAILREQANPIAPIRIQNDPMGEDDDEPLWCAMVTERQWHYLLMRAGEGTLAWRKFVADAEKRAAISKHPLFRGTCGMWNGMLIKRVARPIRFAAGDTVKTINSDTGAEVSTAVPNAATNVDRCTIVGAQAIAMVMGNAMAKGSMISGKFPIFWSEKWFDHDDKLEVLGGMVDGMGKIRFRTPEGKLNDYGVAVIDSYAPDLDSMQGNALRTALAKSATSM